MPLLLCLPQKPVTGTDSLKDFVLVNGGIEPVLKMKASPGGWLAGLARGGCQRRGPADGEGGLRAARGLLAVLDRDSAARAPLCCCATV